MNSEVATPSHPNHLEAIRTHLQVLWWCPVPSGPPLERVVRVLEKSDFDLHLLLVLEGEPSKIYQPFSNKHVHVNSRNAEYHHTPFLENTDCLETRLLSSERLQSKEHQDIAATLPNVLSFQDSPTKSDKISQCLLDAGTTPRETHHVKSPQAGIAAAVARPHPSPTPAQRQRPAPAGEFNWKRP